MTATGSAGERTLVERFALAMDWIRVHSRPGLGIDVSDAHPWPYPEVSGYFIPSLLQWGERDRAQQYADWLASVQNADGSWSDPQGLAPFTFDTGQILKGLLALADRSPAYDAIIHRGCKWLSEQIHPEGRVTTPDTRHWDLPSGRVIPEAIHLYGLEPLRIAARRWSIPAYEAAVQRALTYYLAQPGVTRFDTLSHFHAYVVEALIDLGHAERAAVAMREIEHLQHSDGSMPAYADADWTCSTGVFQYAVIWYRLGDRERADRAFAYGCRLQNESGGFFGSYGQGANYFPAQEIGWAIKYFLDAFSWKVRAAFDAEADIFPGNIRADDGRYRLIADAVRRRGAVSVLEAGCGKGRFLGRLRQDFPDLRLTGLDVSERMLASLPEGVTGIRGSLLDSPIPSGAFDLVFSVEALEHAVNVPAAIRELCRLVAPGGSLIVIDKNRTQLGQLAIEAWEQWFDAGDVAALLRQHASAVQIAEQVPYEDRDGHDGLFVGWIADKA